MKFSNIYGYDSVCEWAHDPVVADEILLTDTLNEPATYTFYMPNTRLYEHFYNDPECNQLFRMGRGRVQPDAITFGDVPKHDYNTLLMTNRIQITPWVTHDQMVIQMFGITE